MAVLQCVPRLEELSTAGDFDPDKPNPYKAEPGSTVTYPVRGAGSD